MAPQPSKLTAGWPSPVCPYCKQPAKLLTGVQLFPMLPNLRKKHFWRCEPCDAHVGCHGYGDKPLGTLADADLRRTRNELHKVFDPLWQQGDMSRQSAYAWLATALKLPEHQAHIGKFDETMCRRAARAIRKYKR